MGLRVSLLSPGAKSESPDARGVTQLVDAPMNAVGFYAWVHW